MTFTLQPIPAQLIKAGVEKGGNPLGIPEENQQCKLQSSQYIFPYPILTVAGWTTIVDWKNAGDDEIVRDAVIATTNKWRELGESRGLAIPFLFMNDASRDQNPLASYGKENVRQLQEVAAKYDPSRLFQTLQNNGFLLSRV